jgi:hypothetical protein
VVLKLTEAPLHLWYSKAMKDSDVFGYKLRALRVLHGATVFRQALQA